MKTGQKHTVILDFSVYVVLLNTPNLPPTVVDYGRTASAIKLRSVCQYPFMAGRTLFPQTSPDQLATALTTRPTRRSGVG